MTFEHLLDKLSKCQYKIEEHMTDIQSADQIPPVLKEAADKAAIWLESAPKKLGEAEVPTMAPDIDPILDYTNALHLYADMFDEKTKSEIAEYEELSKELFQMVKESDIKPA